MLEEPRTLTLRPGFARPTTAQIAAFKGVETGFVCDAMGGRGALATVIHPIHGEDGVQHVVGPALVADNGPREILATMGALHVLQPGDVVIAATGGHVDSAAVGDQFCGMLRNKGAAALVTDGAVRDVEGIVEAGLPVWAAGLNPNSPYSTGPGRVGYAADVAGTRIASGDLIVADHNGVVVVPFDRIDITIAALREVEALEAAFEAKVKAGFCEIALIEEMIADGRAVIEE
jgi:4-hydroxy-4-methyl-2-oxoglutarate aldolase